MGKNKDNDELLRAQINDIIEGEIQNGINDYLEEEQEKQLSQGMGFVNPEKSGKLNVKISKSEIDKILKEYKKIKKNEKSNLTEVKKLGLVDKHGNPL